MSEMEAVPKLPRRTGPRVNLLPPPGSSRGLKGLSVSPGLLAMVVVAAASWGAAAMGLALLMGWRPGFGVGP